MAIEYNDIIRSVSSDQHSILKDIMDLHNNGQPFDADMTYSIGAFYGHFKRDRRDGTQEEYDIPRPNLTFDIAPQDDLTVKIDADGNLPIDDASIKSIVVDLPFVIGPRDCPSVNNGNPKSNMTFKRFSSYYPVAELLASYKHWMEESYRVLQNEGILVWKCQNTITGSKFLCSEEWSWLCAETIGFEAYDRFTLVAKARLNSGKVKQQQHARNFSSVFWVFKKSSKKKIPYFDFLSVDGRNAFAEKLVKNMSSQHKANGREISK